MPTIVLPAPSPEQALADAQKLGVSLQHRFRPEPVYARTGTGFLRSEGVAPMQAAKAKSGSKPL